MTGAPKISPHIEFNQHKISGSFYSACSPADQGFQGILLFLLVKLQLVSKAVLLGTKIPKDGGGGRQYIIVIQHTVTQVSVSPPE